MVSWRVRGTAGEGRNAVAWVEKRGTRSWRVRYVRDDGTLGSLPGFATKRAAADHAEDMESDQRRGNWIDPAAGRLTLAEWSVPWMDALDLAANTENQYRSLLRNHLLPRWGDVAIGDITGIAVAAWSKKVRAAGYAPASVATMVKLLSMLLADAAYERLIPANPIRPRRRGRRRRTRAPERQWATHEQVLTTTDQATALGGAWAGTLIHTAAWTGARWGELLGLQRRNTHLDDARIVIDPDHGALHEINGKFSLGRGRAALRARRPHR
ncbi:hypothetical protein UA75_19565 [Actinoalloteichus sp. GBA129-24]|nr:hypothetical protein UA75_19565 [Actinoalloteichus sp. GBA129-24]